MKYEMIKCNRCKGSGMTGNVRAHLGIPGLCFKCDGKGEIIKDKFIREFGTEKDGIAIGITRPQYDGYDPVKREYKLVGHSKTIERMKPEDEEFTRQSKIQYKVITEEQARKFFDKYGLVTFIPL